MDEIYCIVTDGIVENIIVSDKQFAEQLGALPWYEGAAIGSAYNPPHVPTLEERVSDLETTKANQAEVDELNEALNMILTGYTGEDETDESGTAE